MINRPLRLFAVAITSLLLSACNPSSHQDAHQDNSASHEPAAPDQALIAQIVSDDVAYLTQLGLMRGHLFVGVSLYREGEHGEAATHMKHPDSELYAELKPGLQQRNAMDFAAQLQALALAVETHASESDVELLYDDLLEQIDQAEAATADLNAVQIAQVIRALLDNVAEEYDIAVSADGMLLNAHEYQDCLGFVEVALAYVDTLQRHSNEAASIQGLRQQLAFLLQVFPTTIPSTRQPLTQPATVRQVIDRIGVTLAGFPL